MTVWVLTTETPSSGLDVAGVFLTAKAAIDSVPQARTREWKKNHDIWTWKHPDGWEAQVFPMEVRDTPVVTHAPLQVVSSEDHPLPEGCYRLPDGSVAMEVPEDHDERIEFVCRKYDARNYLHILKSARDQLDDPESAWSRVAAIANARVRRYVAAAVTVREQVWEEYERGALEWDVMPKELERRYLIAEQAIHDLDLTSDELLESLLEDRHLVVTVSDSLGDDVPRAVEFALGIYYPRIPQMAEIPTPQFD